MNSYSASSTMGSASAKMPPMGFSLAGTAPELHRVPAGRHIATEELVLRHLRTAHDIAAIQHLRGHIDLALHSAIDPKFQEHEKKEMNWV